VHEGRRKDAKEMKKMVIGFLVFASTAVFAQVQFRSGNSLKSSCQDDDVVGRMFCMGYVIGVADSRAYEYCAPSGQSGVTQGQLRDIAVKYLNNNPEMLHRDADVLVMNALQNAFPCHKK
jgi:hypothetical protein